MTHVGAAFLLLGFLLLAAAGRRARLRGLARGRAGPRAAGSATPSSSLLLVGFGTKAGLIPLHVWLPRAHPAAPSHVSALMSGVMVKTALYGLIRGRLGACRAGARPGGAAC